MNKNRYKVIYNKHRGQMVAVAENTTSAGKTSTDHSSGSNIINNLLAKLPILTSSILLGLGLCLLVNNNVIASQIHADPSAPKNQQPTVLQSANGTPQINIRTPSKRGVSINQYRQMDIDHKGAILNNSRKSTQTRQAGWVQGNPWLAAGEAKIIVNQINSRDPSQLNGYLEVAGRRAEVIIANPSGININGGGFINAAGVTLTTGRAQINDGQINSIQINQGNININGQGLDSRDSDYTHILSKAAQINAGIWANNLNIISGSNHIDTETQHITPSANNNDPKPSIAIDTGKLGGMYAGKIVLISNDKGVGINNAGQIFASAGGVVISADGHLDNSGSIIAADKAQTSANIASASLQADSIHNSGTLSSQGQLQLQSQQLSNSGLLTSADELNIRNRHSLSNSGEINGSRLDIISDSIHNHNGKLIQSGQQGLKLELDQLNNQKDSLIGYAPQPTVPEPNPAQPNKPAQPPAETDNQNKAPSSAEGAGQATTAPVLPNKTYRTGQIISHSQINNQNGQIIANGGIDLTAHNGLSNQGTLNLNQLQVNGELLDNHQGKLNTNQASIHTTRVDNRAGQISSSGQIQITGQALDNRQGRIQSAERIAIDSDQVNNSDNGTIAAQQQLHIHSSQLNNSDQGQLWSGGQTAINTEQLHNTHGAIDSDSLQLTSNELNNQHGAIRSEGKQQLSVRNQLHNQNGQIGSNSTLNISAGNIDNSQGKISAGKQAELHTGALNNQQGSIDADSIDLTADSVDNHSGAIRSNRQLSAQISQHINNQQGQISSAGTLQLNSHTLDNSSQGKIIAGKQASIHNHSLNNQQGSIDADSLILQSDSVDNHSGAIRTNQQLSAQISQQLDNRQGQISSAQDLSIHDQNQQSLNIDNSDNGKILAGNDLNIQSKQLNNPGSIGAGGNATIQLHNDFNVDADIKAGGRLHLSSQSNIKNNHTLSGGDSVILNAANIDNQASGIIQSNNHTELQAQDSLTNRGLINSNGTTLVQSGNSINNIGSGRIYGNHVAIGTHNLINQEETIGSDSKAAVIAARQRLDIGATHIINKEHALLSSEGDIAIGGALNEQHQATGMADSLINSSARIEAQRNGNIAVKELHNLNNHFALEEYLAEQRKMRQWTAPGSNVRFTEGEDGKASINKKSIDFKFKDLKKRFWRDNANGTKRWNFTRKTYKQRVKESDPGQIIIGGNLNIAGSHWENNNSQILVGGNLIGTDNLQLDNIETKGQQRVVDKGEVITYKYKPHHGVHHRIRKDSNDSFKDTTITSIDLDQPVSIIQQHTAIGSNQGKASTANPSGHEIGNINSNNQSSTGNTNIAQQQQHIQTLTDINTRLPNSSLYHINPNNSGYLVETDPAFTNLKKWLGSDYMLSALGQDPNKMQKRLGDGYYEQRLINEQIARLTGFRRLDGYQNDEEQYKALMNAGITAAHEMSLVPGIALSAEQIARLTSDIVWLVNQSVTLADGIQQTVLVPQVYLMVRDGDLSTAGALISANNISLHTNQDLNNQGSIAGRKIVDLGAQNISNSGLISGNKIALNASNNIDFNGGAAQARDLLSLKANHISINTTTATHGDARNGATVIDRVAGLYVTGNKDSTLIVDGKQGIDINGAQIINTAVNGQTQLRSSEGSVNLNTVSVRKDESYGNKSDRDHWISHQSAEIGSQILTQGDISIGAGKQINIRQGDINSLNGSVNLYGKEGVNISEGRQISDFDQAVYAKSKGFTSSKTNIDKYQQHHDEAVGSSITGKHINIGSDQDINIRGSNIIAQDQTILSAGRDINIQAAHNNYQDHQYHEEKKSGFTAGVSKGVASVGYSKSKTQLDQQEQNHTLTLSQIGSLKGNTIIQADGDLNASAAILGAGKDLTLQGKNINLLADHITSDQHIDLKTKQSGFSVGFTYSPLIAAASTFKDGMRSGDFSNSIVGKNMQAGEAASSAYQAASTPVVITLNHQRSHQTQDIHNSQSVTTQASAGGNLNIIATDGSINSEGARLTAEGNALLHAKDSINLGFARDSHNQSATSKSSGINLDTRKWNSPIGAAHQKGQGQGNLDSALGTQLSVGGNSVMQTSSGDINIIGSSVVAGGNNTINAARNINIRSSQNSISQSENHSSKGWGSAQLSDTEKFTGYMSSKDQYNSNNVEQIRSQVGSLNGNVNIIAGEHYTQQVADIIAANNLNIIAKDITILDDANHGSAHQSSKDLKIGNFTKVSSPLIDLANAVDTLNQSKADDRTKALQTMAALGQGYTAYSAGKNIQDASLIKIESGIGFKSSKSQQDSSYRQSQANQLTAGGNINLISREGDIRLQNTQVNAQDSINLNSARDIILQAGQNQHKADGKNSSAGLSVGVGASIGAQTGVYIYGEAGFSSGNNHLNAQTHSQTTLQSDKLSLTSKGNTTLIGAQANANRIDANIGGKLSIISPQDKIDQKISQSGANIHVQGGFGSVWEASGGVNSSNASGHLNAVNQQSGLFAGKDGYHISADSVDLQGGAIGSTAAKEHNQLTTNSLTFTDIENHSSFKASNTTISGGFSGKDSTIPGNPSYNPTLPQYESGSDHSTTHATISPGQITINGKETSVEELGIHSDIDSAHSQINQLPDLQQIMDKQQAVADATATIANSVRTLSADMARKANQERQQAREKAEQELQSNNPELWQDYNQLSEDKKQLVLRETSKDYRTADEQAQSWGIGGGKSRALNAVTSAVTGILGGQTNLQAATNALAPYAAELIGKQFGHGDNQNQAAQLVAHALLGAISASVNGGNAAAGAVGASAAELAAQYLIKQLPKDQYPEAIDPRTGEIDPNRLPESVKASIRDLSSAVATVSGGLTGGSLVNAQIAGVVGQNAVENNALINSKGESKLNAQERKINEKLKKAGVQNADDYQRKYDDCKTDACRQQVKKDYLQATEQASKIILDLYRNGQLSTEESMILLTSYASKMMQGAGESQDGLSTPIFNMDAQRWTPSGVIANPDFQQITLSNLVKKMKQSGSSEQQIAMRVLQYQIAGQAIGSYSMVEQVDALYHSGVSLNTVINAITLRRGKALSAKEIQSITSRYNNNAGSLVTANGQVIKNNGHQSTASESHGAQQSGGKGKVGGAHKTEQGASDKIKNIYNSIKDSPQYPQNFKAIQNGTTRNAVKNQALLEQLREIEPGKWTKVYKDGFDASGKKVSIHYFQSQSGKVFNVKVKPNWSNIK